MSLLQIIIISASVASSPAFTALPQVMAARHRQARAAPSVQAAAEENGQS